MVEITKSWGFARAGITSKLRKVCSVLVDKKFNMCK